MSRIVFAFMWLVHFLPLAAQARIGSFIGRVLFWLIPERRRVTRINLAKCFPRMDPTERERLARAHFQAFCRAFIEQGILWWSPRSRIEALVRFEGREHLDGMHTNSPPGSVDACIVASPSKRAPAPPSSRHWPCIAGTASRTASPSANTSLLRSISSSTSTCRLGREGRGAAEWCRELYAR